MTRVAKNQGAYTYPNKVMLIRGGKPYFDELIRIIDSAKTSILFQTYIFQNDDTGNMVASALINAARRGIEVYLLLDGYASRDLSDDFVNDLKQSGIHFKYFEPLFRSTGFYFGRRLHHKVIVADESCSLVGGINITDRYNDINGNKAWLDFAVLVEGPIAPQLSILCWKMWKGFITKKRSAPELPEFSFTIPQEKLCKVRMRRNDWVKNKNQISRSYIEMFRSARQEIVILCSYFIPGFAIRKAIRQAVKRGVKVKVIMAGKSDVHVAKNAERYLYAWLVRNKIDIYEYHENVLHGKIAVSDKEWVTIGSYNINDISAFASVELNIDITNKIFAQHVYTTLYDILSNHCNHINMATAYRLNIFRKLNAWLSYQFVRVVFFLFTFYYKQDKK